MKVNSPLHRVFLHFFDLHFLYATARNKDARHVRDEARLATRLAILAADEVLVPAASYFESPLCAEIVDELSDLFPDGSIRIIGGDETPSDFIRAKLETYDEGGPQHTRYAASLDDTAVFPPFRTRARSATEDITVAWRDRARAPDFVDRQFGAQATMLPKGFVETWQSIPDLLGARAFTPDYVTPLLVDGIISNFVDTRVRAFINREYFLSFSTEFGAGFVSDMVMLDSAYDFGNRFGDIRFTQARRGLHAAGLLNDVASASGPELLKLKQDDRVAMALLPALGPSSAGMQPSGRVKLDVVVSLSGEVAALRQTPKGDKAATAYQKRVAGILDQVFGHSLGSSELEVKINEGRKRLDITWVNQASYGVFHWLSMNHTAPYVVGECKNYTNDLTNTEVDQLIGRFSPLRGRVGLLLYRSVKNRDLLIKRCIDAFAHGQGVILAFNDDDVATLAGMDRNGEWDGEQSKFLQERVAEITHA